MMSAAAVHVCTMLVAKHFYIKMSVNKKRQKQYEFVSVNHLLSNCSLNTFLLFIYYMTIQKLLH